MISDVLLAAQPTKRFVTVEELSATVNFLCTDNARSITGTTLPVDGGVLAGRNAPPAPVAEAVAA